MFKTLIMQIDKNGSKEGYYRDCIPGFNSMCWDLEKHCITLVESDCDKNASVEDITDILKLIFTKACKDECLILSDLSSVILACHLMDIPCVAYENPAIEKQDLYQADMMVEGFEEVDYKFLEDVYKRFHHLPITVAQTDRLMIREMVLEDLEELYLLYEAPEITRFLEPLYENREEEMEFTKAYIKNMYSFYGYGLWSLIEKESGKLIGRAGLNNREVDGDIQIELGYMLGVPYQRKGYGYEACSEILKFAVEKLECFKVNCFVDSNNTASIRLISKLGFCYIGETEIENEKLSLYRWTYSESKGIMN